ncbi:MAG: hypothetical protein GQ564_12350 [Bacteroidales bacterium]|nr:hypothetical protein [Bacteroidales bacterium]
MLLQNLDCPMINTMSQEKWHEKSTGKRYASGIDEPKVFLSAFCKAKK